MLFWMRRESHVAAAKIVRSFRRCLIGASSISHRTSSASRHPASRTQQGLDALLGSLLHSFVERHFRSGARWSRSDFSWGPDTMPWTPPGASPSVDHWAQQMPVSSVVASRRSCPTTPSRELRARERARDALGALVRLPRHEARVLEAVHARRAPRAAQTHVPRSPVLQIVGDVRLKRSDDAVSWRCASPDIMRVLRPAFRGARAAHAGSTA